MQSIELSEAPRQHANHLPPFGVPKRDGVKHGAGAKRGDEAIDLRSLDEQTVEQAETAAEQQHDEARDRPGQAHLRLQGNRQHMPENDTVPGSEIDPPAIIGIMAASERMAMIALSPRIDRTFSMVGKVFGSRIENRMMSATMKIGSP